MLLSVTHRLSFHELSSHLHTRPNLILLYSFFFFLIVIPTVQYVCIHSYMCPCTKVHMCIFSPQQGHLNLAAPG